MVNAFFALAIPAVVLAAPLAAPQLHHEVSEIVGGEAAAAGDFPFIVSLQKSGSHFCGGTLLNANTVITAAHCTVDQEASTLSVRAGSLNRASGGVLVKVASISTHPSFSSSTLDSDVAIWKLATDIPTNSSISYAKLPEADSDPAAESVATVAGWGTTSSGGSTLPAALQKVDVPIISRTDCIADYDASSITETMFCAGLKEGGKDSCQGDSGGPIVDEDNVLIGTVSWGEGCAAAGKPGVYARVASLLDYINKDL